MTSLSFVGLRFPNSVITIYLQVNKINKVCFFIFEPGRTAVSEFAHCRIGALRRFRAIGSTLKQMRTAPGSLSPPVKSGWRHGVHPIRLTVLQSGFPPFFESGFAQLDLSRAESGIGFEPLDDFFGLMNIAAMPGLRLGQFQP